MFMITRFSRKIMMLQFYLLIWTQTAEALMDQQTDLGQNVTINCDLDVKEVYWILLKPQDPPVIILRTMTFGAFHYNITFQQKYFIRSKHQLFINNVTLGELGVYYCMNTDTTSKQFGDGTRLHITESQNKTSDAFWAVTQWQIIAIISAVFNAVMFIVVIGLAVVLVHETSRKSTKLFEDIDPQELMDFKQLQDSTQIQYVLVDVPTL